MINIVWQSSSSDAWSKGKTIPENSSTLLEVKLPGPPDVQEKDAQVEHDKLGANSGSGTDYTRENANCSRAFHSLCLVDWLRSITTIRQDVQCLDLSGILFARLVANIEF
ncbi:FANCL C-terminal domain [Dillenia turbinata]|uniref:FANCL C-terminal domain n=1 Tax=Dillenia turbinata TaxID=194707 RepID=A0AAN8UXR4_9MAGN